MVWPEMAEMLPSGFCHPLDPQIADQKSLQENPLALGEGESSGGSSVQNGLAHYNGSMRTGHS